MSNMRKLINAVDKPTTKKVVSESMMPEAAVGGRPLSPQMLAKIDNGAQKIARRLASEVKRYAPEEAANIAALARQGLSKTWTDYDMITDAVELGSKAIYNVLMNQRGYDEFDWEGTYPGITRAINQAYAKAIQTSGLR